MRCATHRKAAKGSAALRRQLALFAALLLTALLWWVAGLPPVIAETLTVRVSGLTCTGCHYCSDGNITDHANADLVIAEERTARVARGLGVALDGCHASRRAVAACTRRTHAVAGTAVETGEY